MGVMAVMLGVASGSTGYFSNPSLDAAFPAWYLFHPSLIRAPVYSPDGSGTVASPYNAVFVAVAAAFLVISYLTRILQLFPTILSEVRTSE